MRFKFWKKKEVSPEIKLGFQGKEISINPTIEQRISRNTARIATIRLRLSSMAVVDPRRGGFERELERRLLEQKLEQLKGGK